METLKRDFEQYLDSCHYERAVPLKEQNKDSLCLNTFKVKINKI